MKKIIVFSCLFLLFNCACIIQSQAISENVETTMEYNIHENDWIGAKQDIFMYGMWNDTQIGTDIIMSNDEINEEFSQYGLLHIVQAEIGDNTFTLGVAAYNNKTIQPIFTTDPTIRDIHWEFNAMAGNEYRNIYTDIFELISYGIPIDLTLSDVLAFIPYVGTGILIGATGFHWDLNILINDIDTVYVNETTYTIDYIGINGVTIELNNVFSATVYRNSQIQDLNITYNHIFNVLLNDDKQTLSFSQIQTGYQNWTTDTNMFLTFFRNEIQYERLFYQPSSIWDNGWIWGFLISTVVAGGFIAFFVYTYFNNKKLCETAPMEVCKRYSKYTKYR